MSMVSMEFIAKEMSISNQTVVNILDELPNPSRLPLGDVICLDEFHFSNANTKAGKYPCVISNPFTSEILDIVESRRKDYLIEYFSAIPIKERQKVKYFITDMNETYRFIHEHFFYYSIYIIDHFHIVKPFTEAIQKIRVQIMNEKDKDTKEYKYLKKNWKLFLKNRHELRNETFVDLKTGVVYNLLDDIDNVLKSYPELFAVYWAKNEFCNQMLKLHDLKETEIYIDFFIQKFTNSPVPILIKIGNTFKHWRNEIINAYSKNTYGIVLTNAMAESNNNYIKTLINIGYGYSNFQRLRKRILYMTSNKNSKQ